MFRKLIALFISFLLMISLNSYSSPVQDSAQLFSAKTLKCNFPVGAISSNLIKDDHISIETSKNKIDVIFDSINVEKGTARFIGNLGAQEIILLVTDTGITFIEKTATGNFSITTVFDSKNQKGYFPAVMSRHILLVGVGAHDIVPSQWYGWCRVWN